MKSCCQLKVVPLVDGALQRGVQLFDQLGVVGRLRLQRLQRALLLAHLCAKWGNWSENKVKKGNSTEGNLEIPNHNSTCQRQ